MPKVSGQTADRFTDALGAESEAMAATAEPVR